MFGGAKAMPKGPKGQKRPADVIGDAVRVMKIATGEIEEDYGTDDGKDKAAAELGRKGGRARACRAGSARLFRYAASRTRTSSRLPSCASAASIWPMSER